MTLGKLNISTTLSSSVKIEDDNTCGVNDTMGVNGSTRRWHGGQEFPNTTLYWQLLKTRPRALEFWVTDGDLHVGHDYTAVYSPERRCPTRDGGKRKVESP